MTGHARTRGFTLIEMLVVVVIVGILASSVVLGFVGSDREQNLRTEAERLAALIEMARSQAIQRNEEWGVAIAAQDYRFFVLDAQSHRWVEQKSPPFQPRKTADVVLSVKVDALQLPTANKNDKTPDIVLFSSGEQTPFDIQLMPQWKSEPWGVSSDGVSRVIAQRRT